MFGSRLRSKTRRSKTRDLGGCDPKWRPQKSNTAKLRIWTLRIWGFRGPGFRSVRQVFCGDASRLFLEHFSKHLRSVLGRTELCHGVRNPRPQNPKSSTTHNNHLALFGKEVAILQPRVLNLQTEFIQYRTGVWKCLRSLSPDPSPSTG